MANPTSHKLTIIQKPHYLHAVVTGPNTKENVAAYLAEVQRECEERGCLRVLIEERLEGPRLGAMDVFQIVAESSARVRGNYEAIAYVDVNAEGDLMEFAETVGVNRSLPLKMFATVSDAEKYLEANPHF